MPGVRVPVSARRDVPRVPLRANGTIVKALHRIEVEIDRFGEVEHVRFVCDGDDTAPCHTWPDCGCEQWSAELHGEPPAPGHEAKPQASCWIDPWFNDAIGSEPADWVDAYTDGADRARLEEPDPDGGTREVVHAGPIETTWCGEWMTWEYAT